MKKALFALTLAALALLCGCHEHTWTEATCLAPATCTECGKVEDETLPHNYDKANCLEFKTCTNCGTISEEKGSHFFMDASCVNPKTCFYCRITEGEPLPHNYIGGTNCLYLKICDDCDYTENEHGPHNFVDNVCTLCGSYDVYPTVHPNTELAAYFGIDPNIQWVNNAETQDDIINNILWNALNGDFNFDWIRHTSYRDSEDAFDTIDGVIITYSDILGAYLNVTRGGDSGLEFQLKYEIFPLPLSNEDVFNQALAALEKAQSISKQLHDNGTITADMSQTQIMKIYYNYMQNYGMSHEGGGGPELQGTGKNMYYDSAYSCLVNKNAACGGRAAAFNLLMHVEGISAQGVGGQIIGTDSGHIISRVVADGTEYFVDWGNHKPIGTYEKTCEWFNFYASGYEGVSLEIARKAG